MFIIIFLQNKNNLFKDCLCDPAESSMFSALDSPCGKSGEYMWLSYSSPKHRRFSVKSMPDMKPANVHSVRKNRSSVLMLFQNGWNWKGRGS